MAGEPSANRSKRQRVNSYDEDYAISPRKRRQTQQENEEPENEEDEAMRIMLNEEPDGIDEKYADRGDNFHPKYWRGDDGYVAGSVVRIKCINFMTYDHVEFRPGPHLNMILGPNGTGKSSIAAAIAIGLAFPPKVMGRANEVKSYVKQGHDEAQLEIELKGNAGEENPIIWRKFNRHDERSEWKLNGESVTRAKISEIIKGFGVQANNLCSFLPQDKVAEFAKMAPVTVLKETMRAAGDPRLTKWHEKLIDKGKRMKELEIDVDRQTVHRDRIQTQVDTLAPDVEHVQEREKREHEAEVLEHLLGVSEHAQLKEASARAARLHKKIKLKLERNEAGRKPLHDLEESHDGQYQKLRGRFVRVTEKIKSDMSGVRGCADEIEKIAKKGQAIQNNISELRKKIERKEGEKHALRKKIKLCEEILAEPRENHEEEIRAKKTAKHDLSLQGKDLLRDLEQLKKDYEDESAELQRIGREITSLSNRQRELESIETQKENAAREFSPSIAFLLDWLKEHGGELERPVHKPPMISVNVPNKQYAWQVESCTNAAQRSTFICESKADYDRLIALNNKPLPEYLRRNRGRGNNDPNNRNNGGMATENLIRMNLAYQEVTKETVNPLRPQAASVLHGLGFDGYVIDYVDAAPAVIAYLCQHCRMHLTAVTQKDPSDVKVDKLPGLGIRSWGTRNDWTRVNQSAYGRRGYTEMVQAKTEAKSFNISVNTAAVNEIVKEIGKLKLTIRDLEEPHANMKQKIDAIESKRKELGQQYDEITKEIEELQRSSKRYQKAQLDLETATEKLQALESEPSSDAMREKLRKEKYDNTRLRLKPLSSCVDICDSMFNQCGDLIEIGFRQIQSEANVKAIKARVNNGNARTKQLRRDMEEAENEMKIAKARMNAKWAAIKERIQPAPRSVRNEVTRRAQAASIPSPAEIQEQLNIIRNQLDMTVNIPGNVVQRWQALTKQLEEATVKLDAAENELSEVREVVTATRNKFEPALQTLVDAVSAKFSAAFKRVKCSGEVQVLKVEGDFAQWGIKILVSYRDIDRLKTLTGTHQSGGERSLATVTYLMSLSEMSRTPFSLVDEINQGMDQRAERAVHNQLVEVTCDAQAGQYFLITPKLLTGLTYHPKMKVLIINNGIFLPDSADTTQRYGSLKGCLKKYQKARGILA
ncbi:nuclear protein [Cryptococcus neoformans 125.91]|nr:nuclear protein [Cryptococcus neoformans var. grubii 125.91]